MAAEAKWFCTATGPQRVALARQAAGLPRIPTEPVGPIKLFDNLYDVGFNDVGASAVPTSAGIILFDTLNSTDDATNVIEPEMKKAGLNPPRRQPRSSSGTATTITRAVRRTCRPVRLQSACGDARLGRYRARGSS